MPAEELSPENIDTLTEEVLRPGEVSRPDVRLIKLDGRQYVVKDYARNGTWFKRVMGAYLVSRETAALQRVQHVAGVPQLGPRLGACALVTEYLDAQSALEAPGETLDEVFFRRLRGVIEELHSYGVAHGDLKNLDNILVSGDGRPFLIDFTSAFTTGSNPLSALLLPMIWEDDIKAIYKLKARRAPHLLSPEEAQALDYRSGVERAFRWARQYVRILVKRLSTGEQQGP